MPWLLLIFLMCGCVKAEVTESAEHFDNITETTSTVETVEVTEPTEPPVMMTVHILNVGQAESILVECDGETMLIDAGTKNMGNRVVKYLKQQGVQELDVVVSSHGHNDHVGGLAAVLDTYPVKKVYAMSDSYESAQFAAFMESVKKQNLEITVPYLGEQFALGKAMITFYGPVKSYEKVNDNSIVLGIEFGERSFLMTADMEAPAENDMLNYWGDSVNWHADVLKVGHHCVNTSTVQRFVDVVYPEIALVSCSTKYPPAPEPMERLLQAGATVYHTETMGHIVVTTNGVDLDVTWSNQDVLPERPRPKATPDYFGSEEEMIFHMEQCGKLPVPEKRKKIMSYYVAVEDGYRPCEACLGPAVG